MLDESKVPVTGIAAPPARYSNDWNNHASDNLAALSRRLRRLRNTRREGETMKRFRATSCAVMMVTCLFAVPRASMAQEPATGASGQSPAPLEDVVRPGQQVAVVQRDNTRTVGAVVALGASGLVLRLANGDQHTLPLSSLGRITVNDPVANGAKIGGIVGAGIGVVSGLMLNAICLNETGACPGAAIGIVALLAGAGAGVGAIADGMHRPVVYNAVPGTAGEYAPEIVVRVGGTNSHFYDSTGNNAASVGVAWNHRPRSGLGFQLAVDRGVGGSFRRVQCVRLDPAYTNATPPPGSSDRCLGSGEEGEVIDMTASASLMYFLSVPRVQPYLSAGLSYVKGESREVHGGFDRFSGLRVLESGDRINGGAIALGGGARVALTKHLSLRPEVTFSPTAMTSVAVGAGLGW